MNTRFRVWHSQPNRQMQEDLGVGSQVRNSNGVLHVTSDELEDRKVRQAFRMMLASEIKDIHGREIYEGDILEVYAQRSRTGSVSINAYVDYNEEKGKFVVENAFPFLLEQGLDCEIVGNFFQNPEWITRFAQERKLAERWGTETR